MSTKIVPYLTQRYRKLLSGEQGKDVSKNEIQISWFGIGVGIIMAAIIGAATLVTPESVACSPNDSGIPNGQYSREDVFYSEMTVLEDQEKAIIHDSKPHHNLLNPEIEAVTMHDTQEIILSATKVSFSVPKAETGAKRWMDYRTITARSSMQWKLQQDAWTDEYGFRRYGDYYMIAMGTYYAKQCGKLFEITLENGFTFLGLISDIKQDAHTDSLNQHRYGNVVEFIVDKDQIPTMAKRMGDMSYAFDAMNAKIASIKEIKENP